ncbi:MAG TPA: hypothetical protein VFZ22_15385, partial [Pyrinomonadaceae bacterium]|nr:hypothetical protein [Pyrinomonadaceae bacterium]
FTACDVPDIARFTEQSSEMTRGIRKSVKDTESLLKAAAERDDLYSESTLASIKSELKDYQRAMKPTVAALDGLDGYLEALNALSQANKKSGENARAAVTSVSNLVTAVTGFEAGGTTLNIATALVAAAEQFRTERAFKKRVTLAAEIVEGIRPKRDANGKQMKDDTGQPMFTRECKGDANDKIVEASKKIRSESEAAFATAEAARKTLLKDQKETLSTLKPGEKWDKLLEWGFLNKGQHESITASMTVIDNYHCGVIDFIKFNVQDLRKINETVSQTMYTNARMKNRVVLGFYESIAANDKNVQNELDRILNFKGLIPVINQYVNNLADTRALETKITLKQTLDSLFLLDSEIATAVREKVRDCGTADCGKMLDVLNAPSVTSCDSDCRKTLRANLSATNTTRAQFDKSISVIAPILDAKATTLYEQNEMYLTELGRIKPSYELVNGELNAMKNKQNQLDALLESSLTALDAWAETHANLRVAVNTKKPLTASKLASKVKEIWTIINAG